MNAVFYHNDAQKKAAEESRAAAAKKQEVEASEIQTSIMPVGTFTYAEGYHQKYYLTQSPSIREELSAVYKDGKSLADSAVATRLNAYLGSGMKKDWKAFLAELPEYGLSKELEGALTKAATDMSLSSK